MRDKELGVTLVVPRDELAKMMVARADAHVARANVHEERMAKLGELVGKTSAVEFEKTIGTVEIAEEDEGVRVEHARGRFVDLSKSSLNDLHDHIVYARDRLRAHRKAAEWLRFAATHLDRERYEFDTGDAFLAYLVDREHPTAMPVSWFQTRGVQ